MIEDYRMISVRKQVREFKLDQLPNACPTRLTDPSKYMQLQTTR